MKEHPILFSGEMVKAILEGRKTQTRRVINPQPVLTYGITDDKIYVHHNKGVCMYERDNFGEWRDLEGNSRIPERGLHGGIGWAGLLSHEIQGIWEKRIRGLVSASGAYYQEGVSKYFDVSQQYESYQERSSADMFSLPWNTTEKLAGSTPGREPVEQQARKLSVGNAGRELAGSENSRDRQCRGETLGIKIDQLRARESEMGNSEGFMQPATRSKSSWNVTGGNICYCPFKVGMTLWVRETWADLRSYINETYPNQAPVAYKADDTYLVGEKWKPSIFMPRWASRITLEVVKVRVERVQEISVVDAIAEGIHPVYGAQSIMCYAQLWDSINAKRGYPWDSNPWVWVIEFKRVA